MAFKIYLSDGNVAWVGSISQLVSLTEGTTEEAVQCYRRGHGTVGGLDVICY